MHVPLCVVHIRSWTVNCLFLFYAKQCVLCNFHSCNGVRMSHWIKDYLTWLYADDTQLFYRSIFVTLTQISPTSIPFCNRFPAGCPVIFLLLFTLNSSKNEFLIIGIKQQLSKIYNSSLNTTRSARNLGFIFDENLTFSDQISSLCKSYYSHIRWAPLYPCPGKNGPPKQNAVKCTVYNTIQWHLQSII